MPQTQTESLPNGQDQESFLMSPNEQIEYFRSIGRLEAQVAALLSTTTEIKTKMDCIDQRLDALDRLANRWKGGFAVILMLGGIAGFMLDNFLRWWSGKAP